MSPINTCNAADTYVKRPSAIDVAPGLPARPTSVAMRAERSLPSHPVSPKPGVIPPNLGTPELATSQPAQTTQPAMATAVVDRLPAMRHVDPVLNQVAGLGLDDGLVHGGVPFRIHSLGASHLVGALSRLQRTPPRQFDTGGTIFSHDFGPAGAPVGRRRTRASPASCRLDWARSHPASLRRVRLRSRPHMAHGRTRDRGQRALWRP